MTKRRTLTNGQAHGGSVASFPEATIERDPGPAMMDIVLPPGLDGDLPDGHGGVPTDTAGVPELAAGDGEIGNTLQTYLREIRRAPLLTPQEEFDTATRARLGDFFFFSGRRRHTRLSMSPLAASIRSCVACRMASRISASP